MRKEIYEDVTLRNIRGIADERERNYFWENGFLKHKMDGEVGKMWVRLVVPAGRRKEVMRLAHNLSMAGHLGEKKTHEKMKCHFTWPGIWKDIKARCRICTKCQLIKKKPTI